MKIILLLLIFYFVIDGASWYRIADDASPRLVLHLLDDRVCTVDVEVTKNRNKYVMIEISPEGGACVSQILSYILLAL